MASGEGLKTVTPLSERQDRQKNTKVASCQEECIVSLCICFGVWDQHNIFEPLQKGRATKICFGFVIAENKSYDAMMNR